MTLFSLEDNGYIQNSVALGKHNNKITLQIDKKKIKALLHVQKKALRVGKIEELLLSVHTIF